MAKKKVFVEAEAIRDMMMMNGLQGERTNVVGVCCWVVTGKKESIDRGLRVDLYKMNGVRHGRAAS